MAFSLMEQAYMRGFALALRDMGQDATVTLRKTGGTFPLRVLTGRRGARNRTDDLTQGVDQGTMTMRFAVADWQANCPRAPEIGDVITLPTGTRVAFTETPQIRFVGNVGSVFVSDVSGLLRGSRKPCACSLTRQNC